MKTLDDEKENEEGEAPKKLTPKNSLKTIEVKEKKDKAGEAEAKTETRMYYRTYKVSFGEQIDFDDEDSLEFESFIVVADNVKKQGKEKKEKTEEEKQALEDEKRAEIVADPTN